MCNAEISKAILSQTLTTEQGTSGSYAMSQTHLQVRKDVVDADKKLIENSLNKLIDLIIDFNFGKVVNKPKFVLYAPNEIDLQLADRDFKLLTTNQIKFTNEYWKRNYGFKDDEFEVINPQPTFEEANSSDPKPTKKQVSNKLIQDALDKAISNQILNDGKDFNSNLENIYSFIEGSNSYEDALGKLADLYDDLDTEALKMKMEQIMFVSDIVGRLSVNQLVGE
jgi:phage gp29-like protein